LELARQFRCFELVQRVLSHVPFSVQIDESLDDTRWQLPFKGALSDAYFEGLERVQLQTGSVRMILTTAEACEDVKRRALRAGFDAVLTKPFSAMAMDDVLRRINPRPIIADGANDAAAHRSAA
jgi:CheY-like chemotaxis protein